MISIRDLLRISIRQVFRQRKRSLGIILAIALGSAGLITVPSMGDQVKANLNRDLDLLGGATIIKVSFEDYHDPDVRHKDFKPHTIEAIRRISGVEGVSVAPAILAPGDVYMDRKLKRVQLLGFDADFLRVNNLEILSGRNITQKEVLDREMVCMLGGMIAKQLFGESSPIDKRVEINGDIFRVIGVLGGLRVGSRREYIMIPYTTLKNRSQLELLDNRLLIRCRSWDDVVPVARAIPAIVASNQNASFLRVDVMKDQLDRLNAILWWVQVFIILSIVATLVLGGFGIWNGMMSSVTARTREIGLKKAMGASELDILSQFLMEALTMSVCAGFVGIGFARVGVVVMSHYLESTVNESVFFYYVGLSLIFSLLLGIVAGFYPAYRASRLDVVTALRYE